MKKYFFMLALLPLVSSCENTWDSDAQDMFKQGCITSAKKNGLDEAAAKSMCDCRLEKVMKKQPNFAKAMENITEMVNDPELKECEPK